MNYTKFNIDLLQHLESIMTCSFSLTTKVDIPNKEVNTSFFQISQQPNYTSSIAF